MSEPNDIVEGDPFDPEFLEQYEQQQKEADEKIPDEVNRQLEARRMAYVEVFTPGKTSQHAIDIVLADMAWFAKMYVPTYDIRDGEHAAELDKRKQGRRELFQRLLEFSRLSKESLFIMYTNAITR